MYTIAPGSYTDSKLRSSCYAASFVPNKTISLALESHIRLFGIGEIALELKELAALAEGLDLILSTHMVVHNCLLTLASGGAKVLFQAMQDSRYTCGTKTYMQAKRSYTFKEKKENMYLF